MKETLFYCCPSEFLQKERDHKVSFFPAPVGTHLNQIVLNCYYEDVTKNHHRSCLMTIETMNLKLQESSLMEQALIPWKAAGSILLNWLYSKFRYLKRAIKLNAPEWIVWIELWRRSTHSSSKNRFISSGTLVNLLSPNSKSFSPVTLGWLRNAFKYRFIVPSDNCFPQQLRYGYEPSSVWSSHIHFSYSRGGGLPAQIIRFEAAKPTIKISNSCRK